METVRATVVWDSAAVDIVRIFVEPTPPSSAVVHDEDVVIYHALDADEEPTGPVTGVEVIGFLTFERWTDLPRLDLLWQLPDQEPLPLDELLKREQRRLRGRVKAMV